MNEEKILHDEAMDEDDEWAFWFDGKNINEVLFCQHFLQLHPMKCVRGRLFTVDGVVEDESEISQMILDEVRGCLTNGVAKAVSNLLASLKLMAYSPPLPVETDRIHVANGTYFLNGTFAEDKTYCNNRLKVAYNPNAPQPKGWLHFLSDLLVPEDIPTLQEYLGYCLIPSTKGQKMLMLIGKGGEGKSRIGLVMRSILGDSMNTTSIQKIENNRFSRADLENKLLMVDDDMDMSALPKTNYIKTIVTAECKMDMERKGVQSYQSLLYARFLCFGNGALTALHRGYTVCLPTTISSPSAAKPGRMWKRSSAAATMSLSFCNRRDISASRLTVKPVPKPCMKPISCGARIMYENRCRQTGSAPSLHRMSAFTMWKPPTTSTPEENECAGL